MKKILFIIFFFVNVAYGNTVTTTTSKITGMGFYNDFASGLVHFEVSNPAVGCEGGFFMINTDPGFQSLLSALISAYHTQQDIVAVGLDTDTTTNLGGGTYCKLYFLSYK